MGITKKIKRNNPKGATGEQSPHAIFPKPLPAVLHGLYLDLTGFQLDRRTRIGQALTKLTHVLLERFPSPAPAMAQVLAQRCAVKLIRAASYEAFVLTKTGDKEPALSADRDYLRLTGSIRADLQTLWLMAKDTGPDKPMPDLQTYLAGLQEAGKFQPAEAEGEPMNADPVTI